MKLDACDEAKSFSELERAFNQTVWPDVERHLSLPLSSSPTVDASLTTVADSRLIGLRQTINEFDDLKYLCLRAAEKFINSTATKKRPRGDTTAADRTCVNIFVLFFGLKVSGAELALRWGPMLTRERDAVMASDAYTSANAAERRRMQRGTVLQMFTATAHRAVFSGLWMSFVSSLRDCGDEAIRVHFYSGVSQHVLPGLSTPIAFADCLTQGFARGGLTAVVSLEGLLVLMLDHGLEYPGFYDQLYSLVTPANVASRHRSSLYRLVDVALTSLTVPAAIVAAFLKRIARVALVSPAPVLYFALPMLRQLLQRHPNVLKLIHRNPSDDAGAAVWQGEDPFDVTKPPMESGAMDSTLWELELLERHYLPAVRNMVGSLASPAVDAQKLKYDKTFLRLFSHEVTKPLGDDRWIIAYQAPPASTSINAFFN